MIFEILSETRLPDTTLRFLMKVKNSDLIYLGYFLESFEGWCNYTTIKEEQKFLQVDVSPSFVSEVKELLNCFLEWD